MHTALILGKPSKFGENLLSLHCKDRRFSPNFDGFPNPDLNCGGYHERTDRDLVNFGYQGMIPAIVK